MTTPLILFTKPKKDPFVSNPSMTITGSLEDYSPSLAYESRLQINNNIGRCTVRVLSGNLPIGATVSVDNNSNEIVFRWPSYQETAAPITNPQAENDKNGWSFSTGWGISSSNPISGSKSFSFANLKGNSYLISNSKYPVSAGTEINGSCQVRQGASSAGSAGASCVLKFFQNDGTDAAIIEGNTVSSGANNAVSTSNVNATAPVNGYVSIGAKGFRKSQNETLWVDDFTWDYNVPSVGTNIVDSYCFEISVKDSANRIATWVGCINGIAPPVLPKYMIAGSSSTIVSGLCVSDDGFSFSSPFTPNNYFTTPVKIYSHSTDKIFGLSGSNPRTSTDRGINFTLQPAFAYSFDNSGGARGNGFVLVPLSSNAGIGRTTDGGQTWVRVANGKSSKVIVISDSLIVSLGSPNQPMYSVDQGLTWSALAPRLDSNHPSSFNTGIGECGFAFENVIYIGGSIWGGPYGVSAFIPGILSTTNGINFTAIKVSTQSAHGVVSRIAMIDGLSVAITQFGHIYYNSGSDWVLSTHPAIGTIDVLTTNGQTFVAGGGSPGSKKLYYSTNGNNWTEIPNPFTQNIAAMILLP